MTSIKIVEVPVALLLVDLFKLCWLVSFHGYLFLKFNLINAIMRCIDLVRAKYNLTNCIHTTIKKKIGLKRITINFDQILWESL